MSNHKPSMLILGAEAALRPRMPTGMEGSSRALVYEAGAGSSRVSVETVAANLRAVVEQMGHLIRAAQTAGELAIAHMDVNLAVAADGSVGLLGSDLKANARGSFTVRLVPRASMQSPAKESLMPAVVATNDDDAFRKQAP
jgi:hypothetical protein